MTTNELQDAFERELAALFPGHALDELDAGVVSVAKDMFYAGAQKYGRSQQALDAASEFELLRSRNEYLEAQFQVLAERQQAWERQASDLATQCDRLERYAGECTGIPASVGICEPIEGFAKEPMFLPSCMRGMAYLIQRQSQQAQQVPVEVEPDAFAVIDHKGEIHYSVSAGTETPAESLDWGRDMCHQHINDCAGSGVEGAGRWVVRPVFIGRQPQAAAPKGWKLVPVIPTFEMVDALKRNLVTTNRGGIIRAGKALERAIFNAPAPEEQEPTQ